MKKILAGFLISGSLIFIANAADLNTNDWYLYNGYSNKHNFSFEFPKNWQPYSISDDIQGFGPANTDYEKLPLVIQEFEGESIEQVFDFFSSVSDKDFVPKNSLLNISGEDLITVVFDKVVLIKRGSLILSFIFNSEMEEIKSEIFKTLKFNDNFLNYINFQNGYSLLVPKKLTLNVQDNLLKLFTKDKKSQIIFLIEKRKNSSVNSTIDYLEDQGKTFLSSESIVFHNFDQAYKTIFKDDNGQVSYIIAVEGSDIFLFTNTNLQQGYPISDYYNTYVQEILESFELFQLPENQNYYPFKNFGDVRDNHLNVAAINTLVDMKIINGYSDGTFKPDNQINRAELTKIIVTTKTTSDLKDYSNCFTDVKTQWYAPYICYAKEKGWVSGYKNGKFLPENPVTRTEALKIILGALFEGHSLDGELEDQTVSDVDKNAWYYFYFAFADNKDLLDKQHVVYKQNTYSYFPENKISRKEVAEIIYRSLKQLK